MFADARSLPDGAIVPADLCIIGAGAAGLTLAREFADTSLNVCLLESGGLEFSWESQALYRGANVGLPYFDLDVCQIRYFGGNTNGWGGWCRPLDAIDFAERPWVHDSGWPFAIEELAAYYPAALDLCQVAGEDFEAASWCERLGLGDGTLPAFDRSKLEPAVYLFSPPTRFGLIYRKAIGEARNIRCLLNANVLKIRADPDATAVRHVDVGTLAGNRFRVAAKRFVLAAGGVENARLLLLSHDVMPAGLGNAHDLVGRYFMEHPHTKRAIVAAKRRLPIAPFGLRFHGRGVSIRLDVPAERQAEEGLLHYSANLHPLYYGHETPGWLAFRKLVLSLTHSRATDPYLRFPPYGRKGLSAAEVRDVLRQLPTVTVAAFLQLLQPSRLVRRYVLESKSEQAPNPESRVSLHHERDPFGLRRAKLDWRMLPIDRRTVIRGEELVDEELVRLGFGRLAPLSPEETEAWPRNLEGGWHQLGTTRMHRDPRRGVVDETGRVHGLGNLFIAGGSVFPAGGAAPPTLTIIALALRLAAHLKAEILGETVIAGAQRRVNLPVGERTLATLAAMTPLGGAAAAGPAG